MMYDNSHNFPAQNGLINYKFGSKETDRYIEVPDIERQGLDYNREV